MSSIHKHLVNGGSRATGSQRGTGLWMALMSLVVLAGVALSGCSAAASAATPTPTQPAAVSAAAVVVAQGHLEPKQFTDLSFIATGQVSEVLAVEGAVVSAGQPIARLAGREARLADLAAAKQEDLAAQQAVAQLKRGADDAYALALQARTAAQTALDDAKRKRNYLNYVRGSQGQIAAANAGYILAQNQVDDMQEKFDSLSGRPENDNARANALANLENAKKARDKAMINVNYLKGKASPQDIATADAALAKAQADMANAEETLERMQGGVDPELLAAAQARADTAKAALASGQAALDSLELRAPSAGILASLDLKPGQFVAAGQSIATLVDSSTWIVKTDDLTELAVVKVKTGDPVSVKLDALPDQALSGVVESVGGTYQEKQGDILYTVKIALKQALPELRWGMTAEVTFNQSPAAALPTH